MPSFLLAIVLFFPLVVFMHNLDGSLSPLLVVEPQDTVATRSGSFMSATLHCNSSDSQSNVTWYKDDIPIETASIPKYDVTTNSLTVQTQELEDVSLNGCYYCVIANDLGAVRSRSAIIEAPRVVSSVHPESSVIALEERTVVAQVGYANWPLPDSRVLWTIECEMDHFNCTELAKSCPLLHHVSDVGRLLRFSILRVTYMEIKSAIPACTPSSQVKIIGRLDDINPQTDTIIFKHEMFKPRRTIRERQLVWVEVGKTAILYCISNHADSYYTWKRDKTLVDVAINDRYSYVSDGVLQIKRILVTEGGLYECAATAIYEGTSRTRKTMFDVNVYSLPSVSVSLLDTNTSNTTCNHLTSATVCIVSSNASSVTFVCDYGGSDVQVQLLHNAIVTLQTKTTTHACHSVTQEITVYSGIYQCLVTNSFGSAQASLYILTADLTSASSTTTSSPSVLFPESVSSMRSTSKSSDITPSTAFTYTSVSPVTTTQRNGVSSVATAGSSFVSSAVVGTPVYDEMTGGLAIEVIVGVSVGGSIAFLLLSILVVVICNKRKSSSKCDASHVSVESNMVFGNSTFSNENDMMKDCEERQENCYETVDTPVRGRSARRESSDKQYDSPNGNAYYMQNDNAAASYESETKQYDVLQRETDEPQEQDIKELDDQYDVLNRQTDELHEPGVKEPDNQYDVLDRQTEELPITTTRKGFEDYDTLNDPSFSKSKEEDPYEVPADLREAGVPQHVTVNDRRISALPNVPSAQGYEDAPFEEHVRRYQQNGSEETKQNRETCLSNTTRPSIDNEESLYELADVDKRREDNRNSLQIAEEYSYVIPDVKRRLVVSRDVVVVGATVTSKRENKETLCEPINSKEKDTICLPNGETPPTVFEDRPPALPPSNDEYCPIPVSMMKPRTALVNKPKRPNNDHLADIKQRDRCEGHIAVNGTAAQLDFVASERDKPEDEYEVPTRLLSNSLFSQNETTSDAALTSTIPENVAVVDSEENVSQRQRQDRDSNAQQIEEDPYEVPVVPQIRIQNLKKFFDIDKPTSTSASCIGTSTTETR